MNIIKQLVISIALLLVNQISCMNAPSDNNQEDAFVAEQVGATYMRHEITTDAIKAYREALASQDVAGFTQMQKAKQYLKAEILKKKEEIAKVKVTVNFDFLADPQIPRADKYDCLCAWQDKLEAEAPLRIELASLKLAYSFTKQELIKQTADRIKNEMQPLFPPFIRQ